MHSTVVAFKQQSVISTDRITIPARLVWDETRPLEVAIEFGYGIAEPVVWVVSRDLLDDALYAKEDVWTGDGDVKAWTHSDNMLHLQLQNAITSAEMFTDITPVFNFIYATYSTVPKGQETLDADIDNAIKELLS